jgi:hypothetical protein
MSRDQILKDLELKRVALKKAVENTGPVYTSTRALYEIASAFNEMVIVTLAAQINSEDLFQKALDRVIEEHFALEENSFGEVILTRPEPEIDPSEDIPVDES